MADEGLVLEHPDILELIPHRPPFLLIDRVDRIVPGERARGIKAVTGTEPHLAGHFPGYPIMPGVLVVEAMAQTAGVLIAHGSREQTKGKHVYFTTIDKVKFRAPVRPGDTLHLDVTMSGGRGQLYKFEGEASVDGRAVAGANFSAMIVEPGR